MGRIVLAYHGCDVTTRDSLVRGDTRPVLSRNSYDWLGDGMYFFEGDADRALKLASTSHAHPDRLLTRQPIATPAVVGAVLDVDRWLDLTTQDGIANFTAAAANVMVAHESGATDLPTNKPSFPGDEDLLHRGFDRAVCQMVHALREIAHGKALQSGNTPHIVATAPYQASRGAFEQGRAISIASALCADTHIQIAVHDLHCIKGWFLIPGDRLLSDAQLAAALRLKEEAIHQRRAGKPRRRSPD